MKVAFPCNGRHERQRFRDQPYAVEQQVTIEDRPDGETHKVDALATGESALSRIGQAAAGQRHRRTEGAFEVISLAETVRTGHYENAYLVLGGEGWTLREYFTGGGLAAHLNNSETVQIVTLEGFVALAKWRTIVTRIVIARIALPNEARIASLDRSELGRPALPKMENSTTVSKSVT